MRSTRLPTMRRCPRPLPRRGRCRVHRLIQTDRPHPIPGPRHPLPSGPHNQGHRTGTRSAARTVSTSARITPLSNSSATGYRKTPVTGTSRNVTLRPVVPASNAGDSNSALTSPSEGTRSSCTTTPGCPRSGESPGHQLQSGEQLPVCREIDAEDGLVPTRPTDVYVGHPR